MGMQGGGGQALPGQGYMNAARPGMQYSGWPQQSAARQQAFGRPTDPGMAQAPGGYGDMMLRGPGPMQRPGGPVASSRGPWDMNRAGPPGMPIQSGIPSSPMDFGPRPPPGGPGTFPGGNYGPPGTTLNPFEYDQFARQRVQQGVAGGGGYSMQDLADAGMNQGDLRGMIGQQRAGQLAPVNLTQDQATAAQELARQRAYASPAFQGLLGAVRR